MRHLWLLLLASACASRRGPPRAIEQTPIGVDLTTPPSTEPPPRRAGECTTPDPAGYATITLARDPCAGDCPVYQATVDTRGNVQWRGVLNVRSPIITTGFVPMAPVRALAERIVAACFFEMQDQYPSPGMETAWVTVTVTLGAITKTVRHHLGAPGAPPALTEIEDAIDDVAQTSRWR